MAINIESEASCRKAYLNYHCYGNSMNISASEMGEITSRWSGKLSSWQATVAQDENQYEFDDSDYANYKNNGQEQAKENTEFDGKADTGKTVAATSLAVVGGAGAAVASCTGIVAQITSNANVCIGGKAIKTSTFAAACAGTVLMGLSMALKAMNPNKDAANACKTLTETELPNAQAALSDTQADMESMAEELIELSDEANELNEDANEEMKEKKAEYDTYRAAFESLKAKVESGESLTDDEKALWQELVKYMTEAGEDITTTQENTTDLVGEIYDDMNTYQEGYDYAAETMGEVEGLTEFAAGFDETTKSNATAVQVGSYVGAAGSAGVVAAGVAGIAKGTAKWNWAQVAAGVTAVATGGIAGVNFLKIAKQQGEYKDIASTEIDLRRETQDFHTETMDIYDEEVDGYDGLMMGVEDLEMEIPEDVAPPEDAALPPSTDDGFPTGTPDPLKPEGQGTNPGTTGQPSQTGTPSPAPAANAPAQQPPANNTPAGTQQPINPQVATTSAPSTAGGEIKAPQTVIPAQCAAAITTTLGLPPATSGDAFDPAQIPSIIANLAPGYDEETIRNVMNGIQTDNTPAQPAAGPANKDEDASNTPVQTPDANQPNTQTLKAKIAFYKPMLDQAAINGWKM